MFARLINLWTIFQTFSIQIPENIFNKTLKSWSVYESLHFRFGLISLYFLKKCLEIQNNLFAIIFFYYLLALSIKWDLIVYMIGLCNFFSKITIMMYSINIRISFYFLGCNSMIILVFIKMKLLNCWLRCVGACWITFPVQIQKVSADNIGNIIK